MYLFGYDTKIAGCFMSFHLPTSWGRGASIKLPSGVLLPTTDAAEPFVVTAVQYSQKEKYHLVECFNDTVHTYAFGHDPAGSLISTQIVSFLVATHGQQPSGAVGTINDLYNGNRISQNPNYCEVYIGSSVLKGFLVGMTSTTQDSNYNLQRVTLDMLAVETQGTNENSSDEGEDASDQPGKGLKYKLGHLVPQGVTLIPIANRSVLMGPGGVRKMPILGPDGTPRSSILPLTKATQNAATLVAHKK